MWRSHFSFDRPLGELSGGEGYVHAAVRQVVQQHPWVRGEGEQHGEGAKVNRG